MYWLRIHILVPFICAQYTQQKQLSIVSESIGYLLFFIFCIKGGLPVREG
jgi:hypothetical protein